MKLKIVLPILILGGSLALTVALFVSRPEPVRSVAEPPALLVQVEEAHREWVNFTVSSQGTVSPRTQTTLVAEASGLIVEVSEAFVAGGFFDKGDVLIRIDPRNYQSEVKRARAALARANTQLATESALAGYAKEDWQRLRRVNPRTAPATDLALRKPQLQEAIAAVQSAEADLDKAEGDLDRTIIRAPYDGLVREKRADLGQYVNTGSQLAVTYAVDVAEVRLPVNQHDLQYLDIAKIRSREPFDVLLQADLGGGTFTWEGKITRSEGVFDPDSRVLYLVAEVDDPYDLAETGRAPLLMGTFVAAEISGRAGGELFKIPRHSLQRDTIWVVDEEARIHPRKVNIAGRDYEHVYIDQGLEPGDRYCVTPIDQPLPGMKVRFSG